MSGYPQPNVTDTNRPLIDAWQRGELTLQHCADCSAVVFFPREMCPRCWSRALEWKVSSGRGTVVSYALVHSHVTEPFAAEAPTVLAEIALDDGGALLARVLADDLQALASGTKVELVPMPDAQRYPLPTFRVAT
jgi:uncharacterized OB-fold protein